MNGVTGQLLLVAALILLNALFAGSEMALVTLREGQVERLGRQGRGGAALRRLVDHPNRFLSTIQIGITLAGFLASATAAVSLAQPLVEPLTPALGRAAQPAAIFLVTVVLTFFTLVLGELAPKRLAMQWSERWAMMVARPLSGLATVAAPLVWVLSRATNLVVRLLGGDPAHSGDGVTHEEVREIVATGDLYSGFRQDIIEGALEIADRTVRQVVTPRRDVVAMRADATVEEALEELARVGHSRAPVYREALDDADAYVSVLSLIGKDGSVADHAEPAVVLPESGNVLDALRTLQSQRRQMALVVSEYGSVEGIVTVEDLVEEIVGEIYDEYDQNLLDVVRRDDGSLEIPGRFPLHDLPDLEVTGVDSNETTVGGLLAELLGRLPETGDRVSLPTHDIEVLEAGDRTVSRVRLLPRETDAPGSEAGSDAGW